MLVFFSDIRGAISVSRSSRTTTPSITAVPVARDSVMAALPKLHLYRSGVGVSLLSGCATSALSRERRTKVFTGVSFVVGVVDEL